MEARSINDEFSLSPKEHCYIKASHQYGNLVYAKFIFVDNYNFGSFG